MLHFDADVSREYYYLGEREWDYDSVEKVERAFLDLLSHGGEVACDTETISLTNHLLLGIGIALSPSDAFYFPSYSRFYDIALIVMQHPGVLKIFHNALFDMYAIEENARVVPAPVYDTLQAVKTHGLPGKLQTLAHGLGMEIDDIPDLLAVRKLKDLSQLPDDEIAEKCCWDVRATYKLYLAIDKESKRELILRDGVVQKVLVGRMTKLGVRVNQEKVTAFHESVTDRIEEIRRICDEAYEFNPGAPEQVAWILNSEGVHLKWKRPDRRKGETWQNMKKAKYVVDEDALKAVAGVTPWANMVLEYRKLTKLDGTYFRPNLGKERVHPYYNMGPRTSRLASTRPNINNVPKKYRVMFEPDGEVFSRFDHSQQELRILAWLSHDKAMLDTFARYDETKRKEDDFHSRTATMMHCSRDDGKTTTFTLVYGGEDDTVARRSGSTISKAAELRRQWRYTYPDAWDWMEGMKEIGKRQGYVETALGRKMWLPVGEEPDHEIERKAVNYPIQGTGAEVLKGGIVECDRLGVDVRIANHDELVINGAVMKSPACEEVVSGLFTPATLSFHRAWGEDEVDVLDLASEMERESEMIAVE